eukprot:m.164696 g.164696  ORF g.164696 m.164696 type:complete len:789 (+) comp15225_c9_seq3:166-2532(+)
MAAEAPTGQRGLMVPASLLTSSESDNHYMMATAQGTFDIPLAWSETEYAIVPRDLYQAGGVGLINHCESDEAQLPEGYNYILTEPDPKGWTTDPQMAGQMMLNPLYTGSGVDFTPSSVYSSYYSTNGNGLDETSFYQDLTGFQIPLALSDGIVNEHYGQAPANATTRATTNQQYGFSSQPVYDHNNRILSQETNFLNPQAKQPWYKKRHNRILLFLALLVLVAGAVAAVAVMMVRGHSRATGAISAASTSGECLPGTFSTTLFGSLYGGSSSGGCLPCPLNTFNALGGKKPCVPCPPLTFTTSTGAESCVPIPGTFLGPLPGANASSLNDTSTWVVQLCPIGTFASAASVTTSQCTPCPVLGSTTLRAGSISASACVCDVQYEPTTEPTGLCRACSPGTFKLSPGMQACLNPLDPSAPWLPLVWGPGPGTGEGAGEGAGAGATTGTVAPTQGTLVTTIASNSTLTLTTTPSSSFLSSTASPPTNDADVPTLPLTVLNVLPLIDTLNISTASATALAQTGNISATCPPGWTVVRSSSSTPLSCVPCSIGSFKADAGLQACSSCQHGRITLSLGTANIDQCLCAAGFEPLVQLSPGDGSEVPFLPSRRRQADSTLHDFHRRSAANQPCNACVLGSTYKSSPGDFQCSVVTGCDLGQELAANASLTRDASCSTCSQGTFKSVGGPQACSPCTTSCSNFQYISAACTPSSDMVCEACTVCPQGSYIGGGCKSNIDSICQTCLVPSNCTLSPMVPNNSTNSLLPHSSASSSNNNNRAAPSSRLWLLRRQRKRM